jgi:hypothetical protein
MACDAGFQEWTFDLVLDKNPGVLDSRLVFCLKFNADLNRTIEGKVFKTDGSFVSDIDKNRSRTQSFGHVTPGAGVSLMSIEFVMDSVNVNISGAKLGPRFEGRLRAFTSAALIAALPSGLPIAVPLAPSDGDTGTATGTQT